MNGISTTTKIGKQVDDKPEQKLKQARLPFKTTIIKKSAPETGKKRKHDDEPEIADDKVSQPVYIDLTGKDQAAREITSNDSIDVKTTKVCIIQGEPKEDHHSNSVSTANVADSLPNVKTDTCKSIEKSNPLQKWLKPKKALVTSSSDLRHLSEKKTVDDKPSEAVEINNAEGEEPMEVDSENSTPVSSQPISQESEESNSHDKHSNSSSQNKTNDAKLDVSTDFDVSENEKSSNTADLSAPTTPKSGLRLKKKLTPKQKQKRDDMELRRQEREKMKQEKEKKRLEEKEEKQRQKEEKERKRLAEIEAKKEEKRQKEEERKAQEEEKKRLKEEERKQKEEEKRQKEEERKQKEEEKRQKEEQKKQKEEQERRLKEKTAAVFTNFFLPKSKEQTKDNADAATKNSNTLFMPFEVKDDMRLASTHRVVVSQERLQLLDEILQNERQVDKDSLYLAQLKSKSYQPGHSENTWPLSVNDDDDDDDVVIVDESSNAALLPSNEKPMRYRCKLLQFHDNRRPAYWGTWRKRSKTVSGRAPFKNDEMFDYEVDSDDEWEDEPGENVDVSDDEKEPEDDYEVDNDLFVPHGYLSDEEAQNDDALDSSPKSNKLKLNVLERQFEEEMKEKTHRLKPRIYGCLWIDNSLKKDQGGNAGDYLPAIIFVYQNLYELKFPANNVENLLLSFRAVYNENRTPFAVITKSNEVTPHSTPSTKVKLKNEFPDSLLPQLVRLAHGSKRNTKVLAKEFNVYVLGEDATLNLTLSCITKKLKEISTWDSKLACRLVNDEIRNQCDLGDLTHTENNWKFITISEEPASEKSQKLDGEKQPSAISSLQSASTQNQKIKHNISSITKFVKVLTAEEKQMAIEKGAEKPISVTDASPQPKPKPKTGITKFVKVLNSNENHRAESSPNKISEISIDLTNDESNEVADIAKEPSASNETIAEASTNLKSIFPSSCTAEMNGERKRTMIDDEEKAANILHPKKSKSPTVNVLIPRKTPSRPITSPKKSVKPVNILIPRRANDLDKGDRKTEPTNVFDFKKPQDVQNNAKSEPKPVNILIPRKAKEQSIPTDFSNIFNSKPINVLTPRKTPSVGNADEKLENMSSKPVNILTPRKTPNVRNIDEKIEHSSASKPGNILIPRRTKDAQVEESDRKFSSISKPNEVEKRDDSKDAEKTKDIIEDNESTDFSLCIESSDNPEDVEMK